MDKDNKEEMRRKIIEDNIRKAWAKKQSFDAIANEEPNPLTAAFGGFATGITAGYEDEAEAALRSGVNKLKSAVGLDSEGDLSREEILRALRDRDEARRKEYPKLTAAGDVLGTIAGGVGVGKLVGGVGHLTGAARAGTMAGASAVEAVGRGNADDIKGQIMDASIGAGLGLTLGPVANKAGNFIRKHGDELIKRAPSVLGPKAEKIVRDGVLESLRGLNPKRFNSPVDEELYIAGKLGNIKYKLVKEFGEDAEKLAAGQVTRPSDIANKITNHMEGPKLPASTNLKLMEAAKSAANFFSGGVAGMLGRAGGSYLNAGKELMPSAIAMPLPAIRNAANNLYQTSGDPNGQP